MLRVMQMHRDAVDEINAECPEPLRDAARRVWDDVLAAGVVHGFRNAQATVLAPTGTISFMMDCDTTGIEPDIALVKYKQLAGGGMLKIVNQTVPLALKTLGYDEPQIGSILAYIDEKDTIEGAPDVKDEHLAVFDCAFTPRNGKRSIAWQAHVLMMAAAQPFLSRRHLEDGEHAARSDGRGHRQGVLRRLEAGPQGAGDLPRRLEGEPAALDEHRRRSGRGECGRPSRGANGCETRGSRSRTSSTWPVTRATSPSACSRTAGRASCSSRWPRKARRSAA